MLSKLDVPKGVDGVGDDALIRLEEIEAFTIKVTKSKALILVSEVI